MHKNVSEIAAQKKRLRSKEVVPKTFFSFRLLCLISGNSFFQSAVFLCFFSCGHRSLNGYGVFWKSTCSYELPIYNVFDRYFHLRLIVISKEHLQPYIWVVPSLFQEVFPSDLVFSSLLCFFEASTCNHPFFERYWVNSNSSCSHPFDK